MCGNTYIFKYKRNASHTGQLGVPYLEQLDINLGTVNLTWNGIIVTEGTAKKSVPLN